MQAAVVRQQQQTGGVFIQAAHGIYPFGNVDKIDDDLFIFLFTGADITFGFIEGDIDEIGCYGDRLPIHLYRIVGPG